jgi:hypothetical protein
MAEVPIKLVRTVTHDGGDGDQGGNEFDSRRTVLVANNVAKNASERP